MTPVRFFKLTRQHLFWLIATVLAALLVLLFSGAVLAAGGSEVALLQPVYRFLEALTVQGFPLNPFEVLAASFLVMGFLAVQRTLRQAGAPVAMQPLQDRIIALAVQVADGAGFLQALHTETADSFGVGRSLWLLDGEPQVRAYEFPGAGSKPADPSEIERAAYERLVALARRGHLPEDARAQLPQQMAWAEYALALRCAGRTIGLCLLGGLGRARTAEELAANLATFADWAAVGLHGYFQSQRVTDLTRQSLDELESERQQLALELHDEVLQDLRNFYLLVDADALTPALVETYESVVETIRRIIRERRPATLDFGLALALEELTERHDGLDRAGSISFDIDGQEVRYPPEVEMHLFRIVQQALDNAVHHSQAQVIRVQARLTPHSAQLLVADDGVGIPGAPSISLADFGVAQHFGLLGMTQRAELAGADLKIDSAPRGGTRVRVQWPRNGQASGWHSNGTHLA